MESLSPVFFGWSERAGRLRASAAARRIDASEKFRARAAKEVEVDQAGDAAGAAAVGVLPERPGVAVEARRAEDAQRPNRIARERPGDESLVRTAGDVYALLGTW